MAVIPAKMDTELFILLSAGSDTDKCHDKKHIRKGDQYASELVQRFIF